MEPCGSGDIGDNNEDRPSVDLYRVPVRQPLGDGEVQADRYRLVYPDGPHDAEAVLVHPTTGRIYLVSKGILGGTVYAAPDPLDRNSVEPDGRGSGRCRVWSPTVRSSPTAGTSSLRTYGTAAVYTFPGLRPVDGFDLPAQEQGEAIAVDEAGRVFIGTEGTNTEVLQLRLPATVRAALGGIPAPTGSAPSSSPTPPAPAGDAADPTSDRATEDGDGVWIAGGVLLVILAGGLVVTASRRRSRRRQ